MLGVPSQIHGENMSKKERLRRTVRTDLDVDLDNTTLLQVMQEVKKLGFSYEEVFIDAPNYSGCEGGHCPTLYTERLENDEEYNERIEEEDAHAAYLKEREEYYLKQEKDKLLKEQKDLQKKLQNINNKLR